MTSNKLIQIALQSAMCSLNKHFIHGCVIFYKDQPFITTCNGCDYFDHAENLALIKWCRRDP